jgi:arylsulfatase A-like enzyme
MLEWIDSLPRGQGFLLTYLPIAGHHPYESPQAGPFPENDELGRYRNALYYGDAALASFLDGLKTRGLYNDTLFAIFGDHGEAFGQHEGNFGHSFSIYEENVRVPYLILVPGVITETCRVARPASLIDTAPTILDLLGLPLPITWQGYTLLSGEARAALFYSDYSLGLVGLRDGPWKFIYELGSGHPRFFNLMLDPAERRNLADRYPSLITNYRERLIKWSAAQKARLLAQAAVK